MKQDYKVVRNVLSPDTLDLLKNTILLTKTVEYYQKQISTENLTAFGDEQSPIGYPFYGEVICDALAVSLLPLMEQETGLKLYPTYTYGRVYWKGSTLAKHTDRPSCQYSTTLCIDIDENSKPWPIFMGGKKIILSAGDMAIYKGCDIEHWREPYEGNQQIQLFLHYVDANGIYKDFKFDKRSILGIKK
jgi:hypothetical protein